MGVNRTQTQIVTYVKGSAINETGSPAETEKAFEYAGWQGIPYSWLYSTTTAVASLFSYNTMKGFVNLHKPTITSFLYLDGDDELCGHALVVNAYDDLAAPSSDDSIKLADPYNGGYTGWITYSNFTSGFSYYGNTGIFGTIGNYTGWGVYIN